MITSIFNNIKITGICAAVSSNWGSVDQYKDDLGKETIEKFKKMTGILGRYDVGINQTTSDFCFASAKKIMQEKNIMPEEIGALILVTQTPDYRTPSTACLMQYRLGIPKNCLAFDINLGCSGFVYGLNVISSLMTTSNIKKALLLVGDTNAKERIGKTEKFITTGNLLFGDAGAAILLEKTDYSCLMKAVMCTDGSGYKALMRPFGAWRHPIGPEKVSSKDIDVFNFTITEVPFLVKNFMSEQKTTIDNYDCLILHQANLYVLKQIVKKLKCPIEKVPISLDEYANTSAASIPITLVKAYGDLKAKQELNVLMCGFGVGLSWGLVSSYINTSDILPIVHTDEYFDDAIEMVDI